jgi:hypothetical protein
VVGSGTHGATGRGLLQLNTWNDAFTMCGWYGL